ncbi:hypothetical protein PMAYCL1PPCAC_16908, partial [Pristionchus mayeri]
MFISRFESRKYAALERLARQHCELSVVRCFESVIVLPVLVDLFSVLPVYSSGYLHADIVSYNLVLLR